MTVLVLTALGGMTEIGSFLFFVESPKAAKAGMITCRCCWHYHARLHQWKHSFMSDLYVQQTHLSTTKTGLTPPATF